MPLCLATLLLASVARAAVPVELPPGQDPAAWQDALGQARLLVPDLDFGVAAGEGATVRVIALPGAWGLDIHTSGGRCPLVTMREPVTAASRAELLLVGAEIVARGACASQQPTMAPPPAPESSTLLPWASARGGFDLFTRDEFGTAIGAGIRSGDLLTGLSLDFEPPHQVAGDLGRLATAGIGLGGGWLPARGRLAPFLGMAAGVSLVWFDDMSGEPQRSFTPMVRADGGASLRVRESFSIEGGLTGGVDASRLRIDLPDGSSVIRDRWSLGLWLGTRWGQP